MGTVHGLAAHETATITEASDAYLATLAGPESAGTRRVYAGVLRALAGGLGADTGVAGLKPRAVAVWFTGQWGGRSPARWNTALDALRSASRYWAAQGWTREDPARLLRRRRKAPDRSRALSRADVGRLLTRQDIPIRERTLWRMLYETAARSADVLRLDVGDLDLPNRRARVRRKADADHPAEIQRLASRPGNGGSGGAGLACFAAREHLCRIGVLRRGLIFGGRYAGGDQGRVLSG